MPLGIDTQKTHAWPPLSGVAAASLAVAGLALTSPPPPPGPRPAAPAAPTKKGYAGAPVNPAPYTRDPAGRLHAPGARVRRPPLQRRRHGQGQLHPGQGQRRLWRYAAGLTAAGTLKPSGVVAGQGAPPQAAKGLAPAPSAKATQAQTPPAGTGDDKELVILAQFPDVSTMPPGRPRPTGPTTTSVPPAASTTSTTRRAGPVRARARRRDLRHRQRRCDRLDLPALRPPQHRRRPQRDRAVRRRRHQGRETCVDYASYDTNADGEITTDELHVTIIGAGFETSYGGKPAARASGATSGTSTRPASPLPPSTGRPSATRATPPSVSGTAARPTTPGTRPRWASWPTSSATTSTGPTSTTPTAPVRVSASGA